MPSRKEFPCEECGLVAKHRGQRFCSRSCRTSCLNRASNPAKRPDVRAKISAQARASQRHLQLLTSDARAKAIPKIAAAILGTSQSPETIEKRTASWRATAAAAGGMTPAHREHLDRLHREYSGPKHHGWKGGITNPRTKEYKSGACKEFRRTVLLRDHYTCQICEKHGGKLEVHHRYVPYAQCKGDFEVLKYHPANGLTICLSCHNETKTYRPDLEKPTLSKLPDHILALVVRQVGTKFED